MRRVGRYEILEVIGRGGTAVVYLATQPDLDRQVALKELSPHHAGDPRFAERFVEESRLIGAMNHPNIVTVHEFFEHDGLPYISMEYLPRGSLRPYLTTLSPAQIFGVAENVLAGLAHGESHKTIHRDLKPENLLVTGDGQVKISDYGVARALDTVVPRPFQTMTGTTIGTPAYMAPEQALGEILGPPADLYSLGIILWEALAGHPPFVSEDTPMAVLFRQVNEPVPALTSVAPDIDPGLARWLDVMLAKAPADRFASAAQAWEQLEDVAIGSLGPRWRREARIALKLTGAEMKLSPRTTTVTAGPPSRSEPDRSAQTPTTQSVRNTPTAWSITPSAGSVGATDEDRVATPANQTMMRYSRRHADTAEDDAVNAPAARRRWPLLLAAAATALIAAGAGVGVGIGTTPSAPAAATRTETTPTGALAAAVSPLLLTLAREQHAGLAELTRARSAHAQAADARKLEGDYAAGERKLAALPQSERTLSSSRALLSALKALAGDWSRLADAAEKPSIRRYDAARTAISRDTHRLVSTATRADSY